MDKTAQPSRFPWLYFLRVLAFSLALLLVGAGGGWWLARSDVAVKLAGGGEDKRPVVVVNKDAGPRTIDFSMFWEVWDKLHADYLDGSKLDNAKMVYGAIEGMTAAIGDPYTVFLPPGDNKRAKEDLNGAFEGVGIQLGYVDKQLAVMAPLEKHPAIAAGVKAGDLIFHIKDESNGVDVDTTGMSLPDAVEKIRGKKGTKVTLTILHEGETKPVEISMVRDSIIVPSVEVEFGQVADGKWKKVENGPVAWLRLYRFGEQTNDQWDGAVEKILLVRATNPAFAGVILDVRNNPGGYLVSSVYVASEFIKDGLVVTQQGKYDSVPFKVVRTGKLLSTPVILLVNKGSASASEIVAGALRDRLKTLLVGTNTFGKGTVQDAEDLPGGAGIHITTGRWLFPSGEWIGDKGLKPDVEVKLDDEASGSANSKTDERDDAQLEKAVETLLK